VLATYCDFPGVQVKEQRWAMEGHLVRYTELSGKK
jgi:hypothetical protein